MRKLGDLMKELGFNENASPGAQEAFLKNLIKAAYGIQPQAEPERQTQTKPQPSASSVSGEQLSFAIEDLVPSSTEPRSRPRRYRGR